MYTGSTNIWCISTAGYGIVAEGAAAIKQRIQNVLMTSKGSDPLRPLFGCDTMGWIDAPINIAVPNLKANILEALEIWMPEIEVKKISTASSNGKVTFEIVYAYGSELAKLLFDPSKGVVNTGSDIVLNAFFPPNPHNYPFSISLKVNGGSIGPLPPVYGFDTIDELFSWVQENYPGYGQWILLPDRISLRMNSTVKTAEMQITVLSITKVQAMVPVIEPGFNYRVGLTIGSNSYTSALNNSLGTMFAWLTNEWGALGSWFIMSTPADEEPIYFSNDFSNDFQKQPTGYSIMFVRNEITPVTLSIDTL